MIIEKAQAKDIDELEQLYDELNDFLNADINHPGWIKGEYPIRQNAVDGINGQNLYVARLDNRIVGSIVLNHRPEEAYHTAPWGCPSDYSKIFVVHTLVVHPDYLMAGIGKKLVSFAIDLARETHMLAIRLDVYVNNLPAIKLYEKSGFQYIDTIHLSLGPHGPHPFHLYEKVITNHVQ